ncbi:hypothetical protein [Rhodococcus jostii]|uniref:hypothetical protein n=1 Tax=Rhodococcus jostii TaxID=132919 RepID=UPI00363DE5C6
MHNYTDQLVTGGTISTAAQPLIGAVKVSTINIAGLAPGQARNALLPDVSYGPVGIAASMCWNGTWESTHGYSFQGDYWPDISVRFEDGELFIAEDALGSGMALSPVTDSRGLPILCSDS